MIEFEKELARILAEDPLGLLTVKRANAGPANADDRLISSFLEINQFYEQHKREPTESRDIVERKLFSRLKGIRTSPEKVSALREFDQHNLLASSPICTPPAIESLDDIFQHDTLGLLGKANDDIFTLRNVKAPPQRTEKAAIRKPCDEFDKFEPLFKQAHADLASGKMSFRTFESELQIKPGEFFLLSGMLVYVANVGEKQKKNFGNVNARLYCIFENGTESHMLLRSLAAALWKDQGSRHLVKSSDAPLFPKGNEKSESDSTTGYIYVLKSKSVDPKVTQINDLHKIGYSRNIVSDRIGHAETETTYLMSDVELVSQFEVLNVDPQKFEALLHRFFAGACLSIDIYDGSGGRFSPREWFVVPMHIIEVVIKLIVSGEVVNYRYDADTQEIVPKDAEHDAT
jgi:hypothetical protein